MTGETDGRPLTRPEFWDEFWGGVRLPALPDPAKRYERCFLEVFERHVPPGAGRTVFEAGCAPGMWLSYFHRRFGYAPFGVDSSPRGVELTRRNFQLLGVPGEVASGDFLAYNPGRSFDVVMSLGFVEHFDDPEPVLQKHLELLAPRGLLILEVPNLTGLNAWLQTPELMASHNQALMDPGAFSEFARRNGLETLFLSHIGGFEPDNLGPERSAYGKRVVLKALRLLRSLPFAGRLQSPRFSAFLLGIFRRRDP